MILVENLSVQAGHKVLLSEISCQFSGAKIHVLLGPNGAGKTTLLKCLAKELELNQGQIVWEDRLLSLWHYAELALKRAVLNQSNSLQFAFSVEQIVLLGQQVQPLENRALLDELVEVFDLQAIWHQNYLTLSGGEQQRVQLARVMAQLGGGLLKQCWLFLDEWTTGLDLKHIKQISTYLQTKVAEGLGVVMVLHDLNLAVQLADECYLMKQGAVLYQGVTSAVLSEANISKVYEVSVRIQSFSDAVTGRPQRFFSVF